MSTFEQQSRQLASILHVDMDSFFVSVELLDRPELVGKPVAVAHHTGRSVVSSASYEARPYGVRSAMPVARAKQLCPALVLIHPTMHKYREASRRVMRVFEEFTPLVEPLSIDEAFLDVAGSIALFGEPIEIAHRLRERVREETGLPCSVGLASTKFVAKLASQRAKPDGVLEIAPERTLDFLHPLPVTAMWGVGQATSRALHSRAIHTIGDLAHEPLDALVRIVGDAHARKLHELSHGRDARAVEIVRVEKSIGHEETFAVDERRHTIIERELLRLSVRTAERLRALSLQARTVSIKVRWENFETITRSRTLPTPTNATQRVYAIARELYASLGTARPVRLIGVRAEQLTASGAAAMQLWDDDGKLSDADRAIDEVRERFGAQGIKFARLLDAREDVVDPRSLEPPA